MIAEITTKCSYKIHTRRTGYLFTLTARWLSVPRSNTRPQSIGRNTYGRCTVAHTAVRLLGVTDRSLVSRHWRHGGRRTGPRGCAGRVWRRGAAGTRLMRDPRSAPPRQDELDRNINGFLIGAVRVEGHAAARRRRYLWHRKSKGNAVQAHLGFQSIALDGDRGIAALSAGNAEHPLP
jgi:hypothetical protein